MAPVFMKDSERIYAQYSFFTILAWNSSANIMNDYGYTVEFN